MREHDAELLALLDQLEQLLRRSALWSDTPPSDQALSSQLPFCYDTLTLPEWLQWIFLPQMRRLLATVAPWPGDCAIAPLAELEFEDADEVKAELVQLLGRIDRAVCEHADPLH